LKKTKLSQILLRESLLEETSRKNEEEEFNISLCNPLVKANIPVKKLQNPSFRLFDILAYFGLIVHIAAYFKDSSAYFKGFDYVFMRIF
jgi:hypothetical protein